jgi:hypothetical protein
MSADIRPETKVPNETSPTDPEHIRFLATHPEKFNPTYVYKADRHRFLAGRDRTKAKEYLDRVLPKLDP